MNNSRAEIRTGGTLISSAIVVEIMLYNYLIYNQLQHNLKNSKGGKKAS